MMATDDNKHYLEKDTSSKSSMDTSTQPLASYTPSDSIYSDADPLGDSSINIRFGEDQEFITGDGLKFYWVTCSYRRRREFVLGCLAGLLLILCIILSVYLANMCRSNVQGSKFTENVPGVICEDPICYEYAALQSKIYDRSVKPCDSIYKYSCGRYHEAFPINPDEFRVNSQTLLWRSEENELRNIIEAPLESGNNISNPEDAIYKTYKIFQRCLQSDHQAYRHCAGNPILDIISKVGGWKVLGTWDEANWSFDVTHRKIAIDYFITTFFRFHSTALKDNPQDFVLSIIPNNHIFYTNIGDKQILWRTRRLFAEEVANILVNEYYADGCNNSKPEGIQKSVETFAEEVTAMESLIAGEFALSTGEPKTIGLDELDRLGPELSWSTFIPELLRRNDIKGDQKLFLVNGYYIEKISSLLKLSNISLKHNFLIWIVIKHFMMHVPGDYRLPFLKLQKDLIGVKEFQPVWERCITYFAKTPLNEVFSAMLIRKRFHEIDTIRIMEIHNNIRDTAIASLQGWMQDSIRYKILDFVNNITLKIGHTELITNCTKLDQYYNSLQVNEIHYKNVINLNRFSRDKLVESLTSQEAFPSYMLQFESYSPRDHSLVLSPHIIQFPFYDRRLPFFVNYAGIGVATAGAYMSIILKKYAEYQSNRKTPEMPKEFIECYRDMFNGTRIEGTVNGENYSFPVNLRNHDLIVEISALKTAFQAYKMYLRQHNEDILIPSTQILTFEQSFFTTLIQGACESLDPIFRRSIASHGVLPNDIRIDIILRKLQEFQEAFSCPLLLNTVNEKCYLFPS